MATTVREPILPPPEEWAAYTPTPGSPVWRAFSDARMLSTAGYATLLQVAHPTVGHGVHQFSSFTKDPVGRLLRTLDYVHGTIYGGPDMAGSIGARVRAMHRTIRGTRDDGERYSAMEPDAFAWVHATLALAIFEGRRMFATEMTPGEKQAFWTQWRDVGRLIGVRYRDLPEDVPGFEAYVARVIEQELEWTPAVPEVMATLEQAIPIPGVPPAVSRALGRPLAKTTIVATIGLLPPTVRARLRLHLSPADARLLRINSAISRRSAPLIRGPLANFGPLYIRARREALARGDVASASSRPPAREQAVA